MKTITSRQNPAVRAFRELAEHPDAAGTRLLLDGAHLVRDAVDAGLELELVCIAASRSEPTTEEGSLALMLLGRHIEVVSVADQVFSAMSPVRSPSGIVAIARRLPTRPGAVCSLSSPLLAVAVDVQDPGNVGAVIRVAEAAGAHGAFVTGASANPFSWKALRGSMGSALRLPIVNTVPLPQVQACLRGSGVRTVAAVARGGADPDSIQWDGSVAILLGGEGPGLSDAVVAACDARVTIPMAAQVESLNVAVAAAVLLYAARRVRSTAGRSQ